MVDDQIVELNHIRPVVSICGARLRLGGVCQEIELLAGSRCRCHGGLSTGPKTYEGRVKSALNIGKSYDELLMRSIKNTIRARARKPSDVNLNNM